MNEALTIDVSKLPTVAFGKRTPIFWGVLLLIAIEATTLALIFFSYLYVRGNYVDFPPGERLPVLPSAATTAVLVLSVEIGRAHV